MVLSCGVVASGRPGAHMTIGCQVSERLRLAERRRTSPSWRDGDLVWLGLLLSVVSAALMVALVWWLVT